MARKTACEWLGADDTGRPFCVHGPAVRKKPYWRCRLASKQARARYARTERGREAKRRSNATPAMKSVRAIYDLSRPPRL